MIFNDLFYEYLFEHRVISATTFYTQGNKIVSHNTFTEIRGKDSSKEPLHKVLIRSKIDTEENVYRSLARFLKMGFRIMQITELNLKLLYLFPLDKLIACQAIPIEKEGEVLTVLIGDPFMKETVNQLKFLGFKKFVYVLTVPSLLDKMLDYIGNKVETRALLGSYDMPEFEHETEAETETTSAPVIKICDNLLKEAVSRGASDIHIEPFTSSINVRFRIDGKLNEMEPMPFHLYNAILARFKIMANMNIAERRIPQDGKILLTIAGTAYDFRVSTIPTIHGEKIVIRIYNLMFLNSSLEILGFNDVQQKLIKEMITRPYGMILLTGPTGSGKSTTLYSFLRYLNTKDTNIITVEDPVENEIEGINQVQVNPKANLTFANVLRSILRQDPNIIMIGEIRDEETADIATRAAITGHLLLSSVHTNDVSGVVIRLINMGIPRYLVADSLLGAISQRLVRKLCPRCRRRRLINNKEKMILGVKEDREIFEATGCSFCNNTGYLGRTGVFEIMVVTDEIRELIMSPDFTSERLNKLLSKDMVSITENAKQKVLAGITTVEEYERLLSIVETKQKNHR